MRVLVCDWCWLRASFFSLAFIVFAGFQEKTKKPANGLAPTLRPKASCHPWLQHFVYDGDSECLSFKGLLKGSVRVLFEQSWAIHTATAAVYRGESLVRFRMVQANSKTPHEPWVQETHSRMTEVEKLKEKKNDSNCSTIAYRGGTKRSTRRHTKNCVKIC